MMRRLLGGKLATMKFFGSISEDIKAIIDESKARPDAAELKTSTLRVSLNKFEHGGTLLSIKALLLSHSLKEEIDRICGIHTFPHAPNGYLQLTFPVVGKSTDEVVTEFMRLIEHR